MPGVSDFFEMIAGGGKNIHDRAMHDEQERLIGVDTKTAQRDKLLAEAAIAADQRLNREKLADATRKAYGPGHEASADFASTGALTGSNAGANLDDTTRAAGNVSDQLMKLAAQAALQRGDVRTGNANLAAAAGKPIQVAKEAGGVIFNPYDSGTPPTLTAPGAALVEARNASAGSRNASADAARARADLVRRTVPNHGKGMPAGVDPATKVSELLGHIAAIEHDSGRPLSPAERATVTNQFMTTGNFDLARPDAAKPSVADANARLPVMAQETVGQAEVRKAREAIAAGAPRDAVVARMKQKGFGKLADLLNQEGR